MDALDPALLVRAASDSSAGVRRHVVRLSEPLAEEHPELKRAVLGLADDPDPAVRLQLACSLGEWSGAGVDEALGRLAFRASGEPFPAAAIVSSLDAENLDGVIRTVLGERSDEDEGGDLLGDLLAQAVAFGKGGAIKDALEVVIGEEDDRTWRYRTAAGLLDALDRRESSDGFAGTIEARLRPLTASARQG
ncbi:MAG: hypothetical protein WD342_21005 [Verrucomicrobiales bacterium]